MSSSTNASGQLVTLAGCYFFFFALLGLIGPYWGLYLDHRGFNSAEIGELLAVFMATRIVMPTIWASIADSNGQRLQVVRTGALCSLIFFLGLFYQGGYWWIALILGLYASCWSAILPQIEVITLSSLGQNSHDYSKIRKWGSVGFIVTVAGAGVIFDHAGIDWIIPLGSALLVLLTIISFRLKYQEQTPIHHTSDSIWQLLSQRDVLLFFFANLLLQVSHGPYYSFFVLYMADFGFSETVSGFEMALGVGAEVIAFAYCGWLLRKIGAKYLLLISMLLSAVRWAVMPWVIDDLWLLSMAQLLHAASFGTAHAASMVFLHHWFKGKFRGRGQALYASLSFGLGGMIGALGSGYLWQQGSGANFTWAIATLIAIVAMVMVYLIQSPPSQINQRSQ